MALTTTTTSCPPRRVRATWSATARIAVGVADRGSAELLDDQGHAWGRYEARGVPGAGRRLVSRAGYPCPAVPGENRPSRAEGVAPASENEPERQAEAKLAPRPALAAISATPSSSSSSPPWSSARCYLITAPIVQLGAHGSTTTSTTVSLQAQQQRPTTRRSRPGCPVHRRPRSTRLTWTSPPAMTIDTSKTYTATVKTTVGHLRHHTGGQDSAHHGQQLRLPGRPGLLQLRDLPPGDPRVHGPDG